MISLRSDTRKVNRSQGTYFLLTPLHGLLLYVEEEKYEMEMKISLSYSPSPVSQDATPRPCACASVPVSPFPMPPTDGQTGGGVVRELYYGAVPGHAARATRRWHVQHSARVVH